MPLHSDSVGGGQTVSVILPTYNRAQFIGAAIASLLAQTRCPPDEIQVVDDGCTDSTADVVAGFGGAVKYILQPNRGKLAALSAGLDRVTGDLVWVMGDDDIPPPTALSALSAPFERDPGVAMSHGRMVKFRQEGDERVHNVASDYPTDDPRPFFVRLPRDCFITDHPCVLVRRADLEALRPFDMGVTASVDYYLHRGVAWRGVAWRGVAWPGGVRGSSGAPATPARRLARARSGALCRTRARRPLLHQVKAAVRMRDLRLLARASCAWLRLMDTPSAALAPRGALARNAARLRHPRPARAGPTRPRATPGKQRTGCTR